MVSGYSPIPRQVSSISLMLNLKATLHECVSSFVLCPGRPAVKSLQFSFIYFLEEKGSKDPTRILHGRVPKF